MGKPIDITGQKFGKLTVLGVHHLGKRNTRYWLCKCECGKETVQISVNLKSGRTKSCGCQRYIELSERNKKHGMSGTRIYRIWRGMISRCKYKTATGYENYGARGISVCKEWEDFERFYLWALENGYSDELTIERKNVDGNYEPGNCEWITWEMQASNKRKRTSIPNRDVKTGRFVKSA